MITGVFTCALRDRHGRLLRRWKTDNTIVYVGQNLALTTLLTGAGYTVTGPYMSLIGNPFTAIALTDTMASHPGWVETAVAGATRPTASNWGAPANGTISLTAPVSFTATGTDTINGVFMLLGAGANATPGNTGGVLLSAGRILAQPWTTGQILSFNYTMSLSGSVPSMDSVATGLTAAGTTLAGALQLTAQFNEVTIVTPANNGVILTQTTVGDHCIVHNASSKGGTPTALIVYPTDVSTAINDNAVGVGTVIQPGRSAYYEKSSATQWYTDP